MSLFKKTFRRLKFASALSTVLAFAGIGVVATPTASHAGVAEALNHLDTTDFSAYKFVPGSKWYVINRDIPGAVVASAQDRLGFQLCKIEQAPGLWITNLKECNPNHPQMSDPQYGILNPKMNTGNVIGDYIVKNYAYDMPPVRGDLEIANVIQAEYEAAVAPRGRANANIRVATGGPIQLVPEHIRLAQAKMPAVAAGPAPLVRRVSAPVIAQGDSVEWIRPSSDGKRKNALHLLRKYANGILVDVVTKGRGLKDTVYKVASREDGSLRWLKADKALTVAALAPEEQKPVQVAAEKIAPVFVDYASLMPQQTVPGTLFGDAQMQDYYNSVRPQAGKADLALISGELPAEYRLSLQALAALAKARAEQPVPAAAAEKEETPVSVAVAAVPETASPDVSVQPFTRDGQRYTRVTGQDGTFDLATGALQQDGSWKGRWAPGGVVKAFRVARDAKGNIRYYNKTLDRADAQSLVNYAAGRLKEIRAARAKGPQLAAR